MSGLKCLCGQSMKNISVPSGVIAEIHRASAISQAISDKIELIDLYNEEYEYWYCPACKRITEICNATGKYNRSYVRQIENQPETFEATARWQNIVYYSDKEIYDATEAEWHITLEDFLKKHPPRYIVRLAPDEKKALVFSLEDHSYLFSYILEPTPDWESMEESNTSEELKVNPIPG